MAQKNKGVDVPDILPQSGGSYTRNELTGELTKNDMPQQESAVLPAQSSTTNTQE